jgi:predicted nucleic-acid-binding protein
LIGLDTNVLVRFFAQDDRMQSPKADRVMASLSSTEPGWVGIATLVELAWVLRTSSRLDRHGVGQVLNHLLTREEIVVEQADLVEVALRLYRKGNSDFADCLIACSARAAGCSRTVTFDCRAARDAGMELIN